MKKINMLCAAVFCACCFLIAGIGGVTVQAAVQAKIELYALSEQSQKYIQMPDEFMKSYQIQAPGGEQAQYRVVDGDSVTVSANGLIEPAKQTWYVNGNMSTTFPQGGANEKVEVRYEFGESTVRVKTAAQTYDLAVTVVNYADYYAEKVMDEYIQKNITPDMPDLEKLEAITAFPAQYDYSAEASGYTGMILTGGGDCWASTHAILYLCEKAGLQAHIRYAANDGNAGSGHRNAAVKIGDAVYVADAGYQGTKPRYYTVQKENTGFDYTVADNKAVIKQYDGFSADVSVPAEINGYPVAAIGDSAFFYGERYSGVALRSVQLPDTIENIEKNAFSRTSVESIRIPASVQKIHTFAFTESNLKEILVAEGNTSYCSVDGVLFDAGKKTLVAFPAARQGVYYIPDGVSAIGSYAFGYTKKIKKVVVPESVTSIGEGAFGGCQLKEVYFKGDVPACDKYIFFEMNLKAFYPEGRNWTAESIQEHAGNKISWDTWDTSSVVTEEEKPDPIASVTFNASRIMLSVGTTFQVKAVVLPENADGALEWVSSDPAVADVNSTGLVTAVKPGEAQITASGKDGSGKSASCTVIVSADDSVQNDPVSNPVQYDPIQNPVTDQTQNRPVQDSSSDSIVQNTPVLVQQITIDKTYTSLYVNDHVQLSVAVLPSGADQSLEWSSSNPAVAIVNNTGFVTAIGAGQAVITAAARDGSGKSAACTVSVIHIDSQENTSDKDTDTADDISQSGKDNESASDTSDMSNKPVKSAPAIGTKLTDKKSGAVYKVTKAGRTGGKVAYFRPVDNHAQKVSIPASVKIDGITYKVTGISAAAFKNHKRIKKAIIGKNVLSIGKQAFSGCTRLKTVSMGANIKRIEDKAFYKCTALTRIEIPKNVSKIGAQAFFGDKKLSNIHIQSMKLTDSIVGVKAFGGIGRQAVYTVPKVKAGAYKKLLIKKGADL